MLTLAAPPGETCPEKSLASRDRTRDQAQCAKGSMNNRS
jgi:hypothetical protein